MKNLAAILLFSVFLSSCVTPTQQSAPQWNQVHGDIRNTSFQRLGPRMLDIAKAKTFSIGDPGVAAPVETPDGAILVGVTYEEPGNRSNTIAAIRVTSIKPVTYFGRSRPGDLLGSSATTSTPAVDSSGNVYIAEIFPHDFPPTGRRQFQISKYDASGTFIWRTALAEARPYVSPAPKLIEVNGKTSIFVPVYKEGAYAILAVAQDGASRFVETCISPLTNLGPGATPEPPGPPSLPYPENPGIALAFDGNGTPHLIDAVNRCGIGFFRLATQTSNPPDWPSGLLFPSLVKLVNTTETLGSPAISAFKGYALILRDKTFHAYDFTTGNEIRNWSFSTNAFNALPPAVAPNSMLYAAATNLVSLTSIDKPKTLADPQFSVSQPLSWAMTPTMIYILNRDGVYALDTHLRVQSFAPIANGNGGALCVTSKGELVVSSRNGTTYIFSSN